MSKLYTYTVDANPKTFVITTPLTPKQFFKVLCRFDPNKKLTEKAFRQALDEFSASPYRFLK